MPGIDCCAIASGITENGSMRNGASMPAVRPRACEIDGRALESQFPGAAIDPGEPNPGGERAIAGDDQTIAARLERKPVRIFIRREKNAADLVWMLRIVQVKTHDGVSALHGFHQKFTHNHRHFARTVAEVIDVLQRRTVARQIANQE